MAKKKVLLAMPYHNDIYKLVISELEKMDYEVTNLHAYYYPLLSNIERLFLKLHKDVNKTMRLFNWKQKQKIKSQRHFDVCLVIRPGMFDEGIIKLMKKKSDKMIAYAWDGLALHDKDEVEKVKYFDDFYVFDANDVTKYPDLNLKVTTNFYFKNTANNISYDYDFYFLGCSNDKRDKILEELANYFNKNLITYQFEIFQYPENKKELDENIIRLEQTIAYDEYLKKITKSKYTLELMNYGHLGLSFRIIESLWYKKKVVTNNKTVKNYDFYSPENIFILDERPLSELKDFLQSEYKEVDPDIVEKYSFEYWFNEKI